MYTLDTSVQFRSREMDLWRIRREEEVEQTKKDFEEKPLVQNVKELAVKSFRHLDLNQDGKIDFDEFKKAIILRNNSNVGDEVNVVNEEDIDLWFRMMDEGICTGLNSA